MTKICVRKISQEGLNHHNCKKNQNNTTKKLNKQLMRGSNVTSHKQLEEKNVTEICRGHQLW